MILRQFQTESWWEWSLPLQKVYKTLTAWGLYQPRCPRTRSLLIFWFLNVEDYCRCRQVIGHVRVESSIFCSRYWEVNSCRPKLDVSSNACCDFLTNALHVIVLHPVSSLWRLFKEYFLSGCIVFRHDKRLADSITLHCHSHVALVNVDALALVH